MSQLEFYMKPSRLALCAFAFVLIVMLSACTSSGSDEIFDGIGDKDVSSGQTQENAQKTAAQSASNRTYCPQLELLEPYYEDFGKSKKGDPEALRFQATLLDAARNCTYEGDQLIVSVGARGRVITGPTGKAGSTNLPIRIAVRSSEGVLFSQLFQEVATVSQEGGTTSFQFVENQISVPAPTQRDYKIFVGFDSGPPSQS